MDDGFEVETSIFNSLPEPGEVSNKKSNNTSCIADAGFSRESSSELSSDDEPRSPDNLKVDPKGSVQHLLRLQYF